MLARRDVERGRPVHPRAQRALRLETNEIDFFALRVQRGQDVRAPLIRSI
jgi:hypothetical protein